MKPSVDVLDDNFSNIARISLFHLFQIGFKYGVFRSLSTPISYDDFLSSAPLSNRTLLGRLIETYLKLGIVREEGRYVKASAFTYHFKLTPRNAERLAVDWVPVHEEIYHMVDYAFISPEHPKILMDFDKDSDFWDMRLSLEINRMYREVITSIAALKDGMRVLDLGCGSVSPVELGRAVGPNGKYVGVDFSPGLLSIAKAKVKEVGMDWVELREMDVRRILPKKRYDAVIMSFLLEYIESPERLVAKAIEMLDEGGKLVILEPFQEVSPYIPAWEFFEGLTKEFVGFPSREQLINSLEHEGIDARVEALGNSVLILQVP